MSDAIKYWTSAWNSTKSQTNPNVKTVADDAISRLVIMEARLGLAQELKQNLGEIANRSLSGSAEQRIKDARDGIWSMKHHPEISFKCGPYAVNTLANLANPKHPVGISETIRKAASTSKGTNLAQLKDWSEQLRLKCRWPSGLRIHRL